MAAPAGGPSHSGWCDNQSYPSIERRQNTNAIEDEIPSFTRKKTEMIPTDQDFTVRERQIICQYRTPYQVQQFLNTFSYNYSGSKKALRSFRRVVRDQLTQCLEAALSTAVILEQYGYPTQLLYLESQDDLEHVLFLYQQNGQWGTVARSRDPGLHGRKPIFRTIRELVDSYADPYVDFEGRIIGFGVYDLANLGNYDWRLSERNIWQVEQILTNMPCQRFHMSNQRYQYWYKRYVAYKKRYPHRRPIYYPNRACWTPGYRTTEVKRPQEIPKA